MSLIRTVDSIGGIKKSDLGRELSMQDILEFVNQKTVYLG